MQTLNLRARPLRFWIPIGLGGALVGGLGLALGAEAWLALGDGPWPARIRKAGLAGLLGFGLAGGGLAALRFDRRRVRSLTARWVGDATPTALGAIRAYTALIALGTVLWEDLASVARLPSALAGSMGVMTFLAAVPGFDEMLRSAAALRAFEHLSALLLLLAALGIATRISLPLATLAYLVFAGILRMHTHFFHTGLIALYLLAFLCLVPCGDGLSLDRWIRARRGRPVPDAWTPTRRYGWARYGCWAIVALSYTAAGIAKLRNGGWMWWDAVNLRSMMVEESLQQTRFFDVRPGLLLIDAPDIAVEALGLSALLLELGMIAVLFSAFARRVLPVAIAGMHLGILVMQRILFFDFLLIQLIFYDHSRWLRRAPAAPRRGLSISSSRIGWLPEGVVVGIALYLALIALQVEFYPLTSWQMYSYRKKAPEVTYYRALSLAEDGSRQAFALESCAGALHDARYVDVMRRPFDGEGTDAVDAFLRDCASQTAPAAAGAQGRLVALELEKVSWHYASNGSGRAERIDRHTVALDAP